jgi:N12 class adenine-specific DNA methylase/predicted RNA methylase
MAQRIVLPNGDNLDFPDGMADKDIETAIQSEYPEFAPKQSLLSKVGSAAKLAASGTIDNLKDAVGLSDQPAEAKSETINLPGSVMHGKPAEKGNAYPAGAPVRPEARLGITHTLEAATPEKRAEIAGRPDYVGQVAAPQVAAWQKQDAMAAELPALDGMSARVEDRRRNLITTGGMTPEAADNKARSDVAMGSAVDMPGIAQNSKLDFEAQRGVERYWNDFTGGVVGSTGASLSYLGKKTNAQSLSDIGDSMDAWAQGKQPAEGNFTDKLVNAVGSMASFYVPGIGVMKGASALSIVSPVMAKWAGAGTMSAIEAAAEADGVFKELKRKGYTDEQAMAEADKGFMANMVVLGVTNKIGLFNDLKMFDDAGKFVFDNAVKKGAVGALSEGPWQELPQQMIQNYLTGRPLMEGAGEAALIGAIAGGGSAVIGGAATESTKDRSAGAQIGEAIDQEVGNTNFAKRGIDAGVIASMSPNPPQVPAGQIVPERGILTRAANLAARSGVLPQAAPVTTADDALLSDVQGLAYQGEQNGATAEPGDGGLDAGSLPAGSDIAGGTGGNVVPVDGNGIPVADGTGRPGIAGPDAGSAGAGGPVGNGVRDDTVTPAAPLPGGQYLPKAPAPKAAAPVAEVPAGPKVLSIGTMPNNAEPITVKDGAIFIGKYPAQHFETGEDITVKPGASNAQIRDALKAAGAIGRGVKVFGVEKEEPKPKVKAKRIVDNTRDSLITAIGKLGGFHTDSVEANDIRTLLGVTGNMKIQVGSGLPVFLFNKNGKKPDDMAGALHEHGYLDEHDMNDMLDKLYNDKDQGSKYAQHQRGEEPEQEHEGVRHGYDDLTEADQSAVSEVVAADEDMLDDIPFMDIRTANKITSKQFKTIEEEEAAIFGDFNESTDEGTATGTEGGHGEADTRGAESRGEDHPGEAPGESAGVDSPSQEFSLEGQTESQVAAAERKAKAAADKAEREANKATGPSVTSDQVDMFNTQGGFDLRNEPASQQSSKPSTNTIFTEDAAAAARALLKKKLGQVNTGLDPEVMQAGITLAGYHIEKGARTFTAYAKAMIEDLGDAVKPYLKSWFLGVKFDPRAAAFSSEMDSAASVESVDVDSLQADKPAGPLHIFRNEDTGMESHVVTGTNGRFNVVQKDTDSGEFTLEAKIFPTEEAAIAYAKTINPEPKAEDKPKLSAREMGAAAFKAGKLSSPAMDKDYIDAYIKGKSASETIKSADEWSAGWHGANSAANPVDDFTKDTTPSKTDVTETNFGNIEKIVGDKLETNLPEVEHVTKGGAGKTIKGVIAKTLTEKQARTLDPTGTFKKDGGWFIRMRHVVRPEVRGSQTANEPDKDTFVGRNTDGKAIYQDARGVRFYTDSGFRVSESVGIIPGGGIEIRNRKDEYKTVEELAQDGQKPAATNEGTHYAAGKADFKAGKPRVLPSYFTTPSGKNPKDWYRGWDAANIAEHVDSATLKSGPTNGDDHANPIQTESVPAGSASETQADAATGSRDSQPLGAGLAGGREGAGGSGAVSGSPAKPGGTGAGSIEQSGEQSPGAPRDHSGVRPESEPTDDFVIDAEEIGKGGLTKKYRDNIAAIKIIKAMEAESRVATPEERKLIAKYAGWGALKGAFDPANKQWAKQHEELKGLLTDAEFKAARASTLDAHYTSPDVVKAMYSSLERMGFAGGRVLEPSVGVGNFFGLMPAALRNASNLHGVELDSLTSRLVTALYPKAKISHSGFEDFHIPAEYFDVVVGNPPFGSSPIVDSDRSQYSGFSIHNYFLAKAIDKLRPGGIMQVVVSHNFLDAQDNRARKWIAERANLIGVARLPNTAFKENAGTEVVTDIVIFQKKHSGEPASGAAHWVDVADQVNHNPKTGEAVTHKVNKFLIAYPDNILGTVSAAGSMYSANEYTVEASGKLKDQLDAWVKTLPKDIFKTIDRKSDKAIVDMAIPDGIKPGSYYMDASGKIMQRGEDVMGNKTATPWTPPNGKATDRMAGMIGLRDSMRKQMRLERSVDATADEIELNRKRLNNQYDTFLKQFGHVNSQVNRKLFFDDTEAPLMQGLEFDFDKGISKAVADKEDLELREPSATKADIFRQRVAFPPQDFITVTTAKDALLASLNYRGKVDRDYMTEVYHKTADEIIEELGDVVFDDPQSGIVTADEYLSGDVKTKLVEAKAAALDNPKYKRNVEALEPVIPADKKPSEISAAIGAAFVPAEIYEQFIQQISGGTATASYVKATGQWLISYHGGADAALNTGKFGTSHLSAQELFSLSMLGRGAVVKKIIKNGDGSTTTTLLEKETEAAREKQNAIKAEWQKWLWSEPARADRVASIFNDKMNRIVERKFDGGHMTFPGMNPAITLLEHQKNGVWRGLQSYQVLYDHVVGAGKTFEMAALAMEMRRMGIARKPLFAVPNHLTLQWRSEFTRLYPGSNILAATPEDFGKGNRERMFAKIITGDWDAVVIGHSSLKKIGLPEATERAVLQEQLDEITEAIEEMKRGRGDRNIIGDMEKIRKNLEAKMKEKLANIGQRDKMVTFDELGVDAMFIDEMHEFKNLTYHSTMDRNPGMGNPAGSAKAFDLFVKTRWLFDTFGDKTPFISATGTPVSNSLVEMYNMQRYMQYPTMKKEGLHVFDAWAKQFGSVENVYEVSPSGSGYRQSTRFAKFTNLTGLMNMYNTFADTVTLDDLKAQEEAQGKRFPVPKLVGGRPEIVVAKRSPMVAERMGIPRAEEDESGAIKFDLSLNSNALPEIEQVKDTGKWHAKATQINGEGIEYLTDIGQFDTEEDARLKIVERALSPVVTVDPESILGRFGRLRELTRATKGKVNALSLTGEANKLGLDYRLIDPSAPDFAGSKINLAVDKMVKVYHQWDADKGAQLVFCDMSIPLSARATFGASARRLYVRDEYQALEMKRGTLHTLEGHEDLPYFVVQRGEKDTKRFDAYDAVSGGKLFGDMRTKQEARDRANEILANTDQRQTWIENRERLGEISQEQIDEYNNENEVETEGFEFFSREDVAGMSGSSRFSVYDDIKAKLIKQGIPEREIAFIHDYSTPAAKDKLFKAVNKGAIRFLLGSTPKMGAGTNVQERLVGLHHIDAPWRPSDLEQREGRIIRRGNKLYERAAKAGNPDSFEIYIGRYATEQTYDTRRWQILEHKARGIEQLRNFDGTINEIDDIEGEAANSADMKAAASGDPLILDETKLRNDVRRLEQLQAGHADEVVAMARKAKAAQEYADTYGPKNVAELQELLDEIKKHPLNKDGYSPITVNTSKFADKEKAIKEIESVAGLVRSGLRESATIVYRGISFRLSAPHANIMVLDSPTGGVGTWSGSELFSASGFVQRLVNYAGRLPAALEDSKAKIEKSKQDAAAMVEQSKQPFAQSADLEHAREEHKKVQRALMAKGPAVPDEQKAAVAAGIEAQKAKLVKMGYGDALREYSGSNVAKETDQGTALYSRGDNAVRPGDVYRTPDGRAATITRTLPFGLAEVRLQKTGQLRVGSYQVAIIKEWEKIGQADSLDGAYDTPQELIDLAADKEAKLSRGNAQSGQPKAAVEAMAKKIMAHWKNAPSLTVVQSIEDLPADLRDQVYSANAENDMEGVYLPKSKQVYLVADHLPTPQRALFVLIHEAIGHHGLRGVFGDGIAPVMRQIYLTNKSVRIEADKLMKQYGYDAALATEEVLADMPGEVAIEKLNGWKRIVAYIMGKLRQWGITDKWTDSDVIALLAKAGRHVIDGGELKAIGGENVALASRQANLNIPGKPAPITPRQGGLGLNATPHVNQSAWDAPEASKMDNIIYELQDKHVDTKRVIEAINKNGQIKDSFDPYLQEELYHKRTAKRVSDFQTQELKPLLVEMTQRGVDIAQMEEYLHARHAKEANQHIADINPGNPDMQDGGSGMTNQEADDYLNGLAPERKKTLSLLAGKVDAMIAKTRQTLVDYRIESGDTIQSWSDAYQHYVPLFREDVGSGPGTGQGFSVRGSSSKARTGSKRKVVDIIGNIAMQRERAVVRGEKNRVALALYGLAKTNPNPDFWTADKAPSQRVLDEDTNTVVTQADPLFKSRENVVVSRMVNPQTGKVEEHAVVFNERDERAMRMAAAMKNLDMDDLGHVLGLAAKGTRYFASINTQYNPIFGLMNVTRDIQGALVNLSSTPIAGHQKEVLQHTLSAMRGIYSDIRDHRKGVTPSSKWATLWEEMQNEGGTTGYSELFRTSEDRAKALQSEIAQISEGKLKHAGRAIFDWLSDYNETMENSVRLAAYKTAIDNGMSKPRAASLAKTLTVNFNRKGRMGSQAGALYAFFNASMQGTARMAEALKGPAGKKIILGGLTIGVMQALALAMAGFDDDEPPEFVRERNIIIPLTPVSGKKNYLTIPMPLGLHVIPNIGRLATELALGGFRHPGDKAAQLLGILMSAFNPIGSATALQTITPTLIDPIAALAENKDWTGKPIYREERNGMNPTPGFTRAKNTSSFYARWAAEAINTLTGGTDYQPGKASPTPDQIDYLIGQVTGGVGREASKVVQSGESMFSGEELPAYKRPLLGRLYGDAEEGASQAGRFYDNLKRINGHEAEIKGRATHHEEYRSYITDNPESKLIGPANEAENIVRHLNKQKRMLIEKEAPRAQIKQIEAQITAKMTKFNDKVRALSTPATP